MPSSTRQAKLQWHCRRGMLELDIILGRFLTERFMQLSENDQNDFEKLLNNHDQDLFNWLVHKQIPTDPSLVHIVAQITSYASTKS